jgi:hypothetical protein
MDTIKTVTAYSFDSQGVQHPQYWQGAGVAYTDWRACYTGAGESEQIAALDAIEQAATSESIAETMLDEMDTQARADFDDTLDVCSQCDDSDDCDVCGRSECELTYYVVLFVR